MTKAQINALTILQELNKADYDMQMKLLKNLRETQMQQKSWANLIATEAKMHQLEVYQRLCERNFEEVKAGKHKY